MPLQTNYTCWTIADVVATIPTEAATPSAEVLLATHAPLRITRHDAIAGSSGPTIVDEYAVLKEFLEREPTKGILVAPVVGESGTGKSHLVRWVHANLVSQATSAPKRHVIYLRKTDTSLKNVVEQLLVGQTGPQFDEIRSKLDSLGASVSQETMESRILDSLAEALENHEVTGTVKILTGQNGLALFFRDPLFRDHLRREGSFVQRRARHALFGRDVDEADIPLEFTASELPLDIGNFASIADAAAATRKIFRLVSTNASLQNAAVELINELLHVAVTRAAGLSVGDISQAFLQMRANLLGDEIILLIEDVALIQGVRRDLLDAIVEPAEDQGKVKYATVRTMMAVTSGYYNETLPETFRYRAEASGPRYQVDMDLTNMEADEDFFADFVGRYLNAARVGKHTLETASPTVPNPCDQCTFKESCHTTFGHDSEGHGLYPYNKVAVRRVVQTLADSSPDGTRTFNPRRVLAKGVRDTLREGADQIKSGQFPPAEFLGGSGQSGLLTLPMAVSAQIEEGLAEKDAGRAISLLTFWGDAGKKSIPTDLYRVFSQESLAKIDMSGTGPGPVIDKDEPEIPGAKNPSPYSAALVNQLKAIEKWSAGDATLTQAIARDLRAIVREALLSKVSWSAPLTKEPDSSTIDKAIRRSAHSISIADAGENLIGTSPVLKIPRSATMGQLFTGLLLIKEGYGQDAGPALARLDALVTPAVPAAHEAIMKEYEASDAVIVDTATSLLVGAARCGHLPASPQNIDLLNAVLWAPDGTAERADAASRTPAWLAAHQAYVKNRPVVIKHFVARVGAAQGSGSVYGIDVVRLLPLLRKAWQQAQSQTAEALVLPNWAKESERLSKDLMRASSAQIAHWRDLVERAQVHLSDGGTWSETLDVLTSTITIASQAGLVIHPNLPALQANLKEARAYEGRSVTDVAKLLTRVDVLTSGKASRLIGVEVGGDLSGVVGLLEQSAKWVDNGLEIAKGDVNDDTNLDEELQAAIDELRAIVDEYTPSTDRHEQTFEASGAEHV